MNIDHAWREIRGTAAETVLLNTYRAGGEALPSVYRSGVQYEGSAFRGADRLVDLGLALSDRSEALEVALTGDGNALGARIVQSRIDGPERWDAIQRAVLVFIRDKAPDRAVDIVGCDDGNIDGRPVTEDEVLMQWEYLSLHELAKSITRAWGAPDLRPRITNRGQYAIYEPNIREYVEGGFMSQITNDNSIKATISDSTIGAMVGGQGNTASVSQIISRDERTQTLALIDRILGGLGDAGEDITLRAKVEEIKAELEGSSPSRHGIVSKARDALLLASATEGGRQVIQWIGQIASGLGT